MLIAVGIVIAQIAGVYNMIYEADYTMLSFAIMGLAILMTGRCGYLTFLASRTTDPDKLQSLDISKEAGWMSATWCARIGLVGTVIGFIMMLGGLRGVDFTDVTSTQKVISSMSVGIGVALWTTLIGQICSIILTLQYFNLSQYLERLIPKEDASGAGPPPLPGKKKKKGGKNGKKEN